MSVLVNMQCIITVLIVKKATVSKSQNVKDSSHANKYLRKQQTRLTALFSETTQVSRYQKGKTNLDFSETRDSEWQWHQLGHMQVCTSLQTDNHASISTYSNADVICYIATWRMEFA